VHSALGVKRLVAVLLAVAMVLPGPLLADEPPPAPRPFKGQTLFTERIEPRDRVFARLLFAGRVMILAREGSALSITEVAAATTIEVVSGRVAVTVDRQNLHPEDLVEVRTPHAAVTVPSGTLVYEVADASTFTAAGRPVEVFRLDPVSGAALEPPTVAAADEAVTVESPRMSSGVVANR
jgi:hypothetical protein